MKSICTGRINLAGCCSGAQDWQHCGGARVPSHVALLVMILLAAASARAQESAPTEYQLKAAFLYNFAKFIDWPRSSFVSDQSPFAICILGVDPFGAAIDDTLRGKAIRERPVVVQRAKDAADVRHCQIVFISASEKTRLSEILAALQGANTLIVGDTDRFADSGGTIQFMLEQNHVRFAINTDAAESAGLRISSRLLALSKIVHSSESGRN
ncbi:MAG TPA: YfiR family protein [Candidatus Acidoferrum sp.]|nr:YfiR family protein [Candidatus Acidoferrum sp.]